MFVLRAQKIGLWHRLFHRLIPCSMVPIGLLFVSRECPVMAVLDRKLGGDLNSADDGAEEDKQEEHTERVADSHFG